MGETTSETKQRIDTTMLERPVVKLVGEDGNAFAVMGRVQSACQTARWPKEKIDALLAEMCSGDYDHLLATAVEYCDQPDGEEDEWEEDSDES